MTGIKRLYLAFAQGITVNPHVVNQAVPRFVDSYIFAALANNNKAVENNKLR
jgi:hypothetical protein